MSISSEIDRIEGAKSDIADAIEDMGVTVPTGTKIDGLATLIRSGVNGHIQDTNNPHQTTAAQVGAIRKSADHLISGAAGWYKFYERQASSGAAARKHIFLIQEVYSYNRSAILSFYSYRNSSGNWTSPRFAIMSSSIYSKSDFAMYYSGNTISLYVNKGSNSSYPLAITLISSMSGSDGVYVDPSAFWKSEAVTEPPSGSVYAISCNDGAGNIIEDTYVPNTRTVNGKALSSNISLTASDVGAATTSDIPSAYASNPAMDGTASAGSSGNWARGDHVHPSDTSRVPTSRTVNGKALSADISLTAMDVGAAPYTDGIYYAICTSAASAQDKEIPWDSNNPSPFYDGAKFRIRFSTRQMYDGQPNLVFGNQSRRIYRPDGTSAGKYEWNVGDVIDFVYVEATTRFLILSPVLTYRTVNGKSLIQDVTLGAGDVGAQAAIKSDTIALSLSWSGSGPYTQTVTVTGATVTSNSLISLQPTAAQLAQLITDGVQALTIENNSGTLTAYALGAVPSVAMTIACTITEVETGL